MFYRFQKFCEKCMPLEKLKSFLDLKGWVYQYVAEDGLGSIDFEYLGVSYLIWEFADEQRGAESNVRNIGKLEDYQGHYENDLIEIMKKWEE